MGHREMTNFQFLNVKGMTARDDARTKNADVKGKGMDLAFGGGPLAQTFLRGIFTKHG